jgi:hypothetical protein
MIHDRSAREERRPARCVEFSSPTGSAVPAVARPGIDKGSGQHRATRPTSAASGVSRWVRPVRRSTMAIVRRLRSSRRRCFELKCRCRPRPSIGGPRVPGSPGPAAVAPLPAHRSRRSRPGRRCPGTTPPAPHRGSAAGREMAGAVERRWARLTTVRPTIIVLLPRGQDHPVSWRRDPSDRPCRAAHGPRHPAAPAASSR